MYDEISTLDYAKKQSKVKSKYELARKSLSKGLLFLQFQS
uniref:Uncharacterized protein n=1 Tax=Clostridium perfringens TaxID=1502 RepID=X5I2W3_CLOPF|nr:hypothetical protein [Clostridium perfringens]BAO58389.1 hypothetical protein [Clostridium perfringens]